MSLCVRYIEDCRIREDFLTFIPNYDASGKGLAHTIMREIDKLGLKKENLVGQGYDGASSMSGIYNGVQKNICNIVPYALYVHCAAHSLNLAISKSCDITEIRNCIGSISSITSFFRKSPIRSDILKKFIKDLIPDTRQQTLLKMCETHWVERHDSLMRFKELYLSIANTLRELEHHHNLETSQHAFQLSKTITSSSFVISLYVTEKLFAITLSLCKSLQKINVDLSECCAYVNNCVQVINSIRENSEEEFHKLFLEVENVLSLVDETVKTPRLIRQSIHHNNIPADSPEQYYKRSIFLPFLDYFKNQLNERFLKHNNIISGLQNLLPCFLIKLNASSNEFKKCIDFYKSFLPTYDTFESELKVWMEKWKSVSDKELPKSAIDTLSVMSKDRRTYIQTFGVYYPTCNTPSNDFVSRTYFFNIKTIKNLFEE